MRRGDIVRLKQAIQIHAGKFEEFTHGIVVARIKTKADPSQGEIPLTKAIVKELMVYLYNPDTHKICLDEDGVPILFDVQLGEVDLFKQVKKRADEMPDEEDFKEQINES
jgi:hypothetical protein